MTEEFRHIVRIAGTDLKGSQKLLFGLTKIKGIGPNMARAVTFASKVDPTVRIGNMTDGDVQRIESVLKEAEKHGIPAWMWNRRKDLQTGKDVHLIGSDLTLSLKSDIDFMKKVQSWKGIRHSLGLKVRGQRTKTTGRTGRVVGVSKKKVMAKRAAEEKK